MPDVSNIVGQSTNGIIGNYAQSYIGQIFSTPATAVGGVMQTSNSSGIRGLGAGVSTLGASVGGSIGRGVYDSVLKNGLSTKSISLGVGSGFKSAFNFSDGKFGKLSSTGAGLGMNAAGAILSAIGGPKQEYAGEKGDVTKGLDSAYDIAQTAVGFIPGVGTMVSGLMSLNKGVTGMLNKWGGGTDAMTDADAVLGSNWFGPVGSINGFLGKKSHTMGGKDFMTQNKLNNVWAGYGGTYADYNKALSKENKKYGWVSSGARKRANKLIDQANINREYLLDMNNEAELGNIRGNVMAGINATNYYQSLTGGIKPMAMGRNGMKIKLIKTLAKRKLKLGGTIQQTSSTIIPWQPTEEEIEKFLQGGNFKLIPYSEWKKGIDFLINDDYDLETAYNELPIEELEQWKKSKGLSHLSSKYKKDNHPTYSDPGYGWFGSDEIGWTFYPSPRQMLNRTFDEYVEYWKKAEPNSTLNYGGRTYVNTPIAYHKEGGSMNVIPEGSLHARLHHMEDADGLTKKGIPVVDNEGNLLAEIELNEIIFRKEVTNKLEELSKDGSNKAAEEAGRLLVKEIFENTDDRTGLIKEVTGDDGVLKAEFGAAMPEYVKWMLSVIDSLKTNTSTTGNKLNSISNVLTGINQTVATAGDILALVEAGKRKKEEDFLKALKEGFSLARWIEKQKLDYQDSVAQLLEQLKNPTFYQQLSFEKGGEIPSFEDFMKSKLADMIAEYYRTYGGKQND